MAKTTACKSYSRHEQYRGSCRVRFFKNVFAFVGHAVTVCLIFVGLLALLRLIMQYTEHVDFPTV